jgi:site-specific DNA-methyltransferase (adenine-specific)
MNNRIILGDSQAHLKNLPEHFAQLIYIDPPENQNVFRRCVVTSIQHYVTGSGSLVVHAREDQAHYVRTFMDMVLGSDRFMNEIIWVKDDETTEAARDCSSKGRRVWSKSHDTLLWYVVDPENYTFNYEDMDRIPYMAPGLVTPEKAERGKTPTDVWWNLGFAVGELGPFGYPRQKPVSLLERIIKIHCVVGDVVLDPFAGSGTTGEAAARHSRKFVLIDNNQEAHFLSRKRLEKYGYAHDY